MNIVHDKDKSLDIDDQWSK